ncbi:hypothetical protein [Streptomyces sp. NRRL S-1868]|uniref:hypothetical protein n=1 Tax=Streptomyces sp. NRRL S-1868 TaxID=1463892 RepID=UPI0004C7533C|nr:hypothetical protein [Streptomyces sp. NRRL S-1868]
MTERTTIVDLPQTAASCPPPPKGCGAPAGSLCTLHGGTRPHTTNTHRARTDAWAVQTATCTRAGCEAAPGHPCRDSDGQPMTGKAHTPRKRAALRAAHLEGEAR